MTRDNMPKPGSTVEAIDWKKRNSMMFWKVRREQLLIGVVSSTIGSAITAIMLVALSWWL